MSEKRKYCGHCQEFVTLRTYRTHEKLFFIKETGIWKTCVVSSDEEDEHSIRDDINDSSQDECEGKFPKDKGDDVGSDCFHESDCQSSVCSDDDDSSDSEWLYKERVFPINPEIWEISEEDINVDFERNSIPHVSNDLKGNASNPVKNILRWALVFLSIWAAHCKISETALELLLSFLHRWFTVLGTIFPPFAVFISFPTTISSLRTYLGIEKDSFTKYVVCNKCSSLYSFHDCYELKYGKKVTKKCQFISFPHHRQVHRRQRCNVPLLREVVLKNGKCHLYPFKIFCYKSISETLKNMISRNGFLQKCELWRSREVPNGFLADVFDGRVWREWQFVEGKPFLAAPDNYALMLNVDWFQPFKHSVYSVGAMYLVIMNLPRSERFKPENVLLVGLIPGPKEPSLNINTYLKPMVTELNLLWTDGININSEICIRAALLCIACDLPAVRKVCGFTGHGARNGCSKCKKAFLGVVGKMDFSGFEPSPPRKNAEHRQQAQEVLNQTSMTDQAAAEQRYGTRFTELMMLPYFDCVRYHVVDPMHNLFLGTSKHLMKNIWLQGETPLIERKDLMNIQKKLDTIKAPSSIGRMPKKIENSYGGFTADQWKTWTILFSVFSLWNVLPDEHLKLWHDFVMACILYCAPVITEGRAEVGHSHILKFCKGFENLYGKEKVTPNMHMHTHILDCILDYGPVYSFWLFSFERYNGLLGEIVTNQRSVEVQLMRKFTSEQFVRNLELPVQFGDSFLPIFEKLNIKNTGTLASELEDMKTKEVIETSMLAIGPVRKNDSRWRIDERKTVYELRCPYSLESLDAEDLALITRVYMEIFDGLNVESVTTHFNRYAGVFFAGEYFGSLNSRGERSCYIMARWCSLGGVIDKAGTDLRPGVIDYILEQSIEVNDNRVKCILAAVRWFSVHPQRHKLGSPTEVWCRNVWELDGCASFIPVQRIFCRFFLVYDVVDGERVLIVCPVPRKFQC
ncbi:uncharacterized protein LOC114539750 [Dendronephthya gigantea]|uniref:uncharacterized protein LOC114539750 n=1 Tax=Dendronephthya gigantea TaxID=151771 RepID=UPI00106CF6AB|nr:uncharacterized protein LOC114539750 [Dendronephthya gigantea]